MMSKAKYGYRRKNVSLYSKGLHQDHIYSINTCPRVTCSIPGERVKGEREKKKNTLFTGFPPLPPLP